MGLLYDSLHLQKTIKSKKPILITKNRIMKTPKEVFQTAISDLGLTKFQIMEIKILGLELARDEWKAGFNQGQQIFKDTLGILTPEAIDSKCG